MHRSIDAQVRLSASVCRAGLAARVPLRAGPLLHKRGATLLQLLASQLTHPHNPANAAEKQGVRSSLLPQKLVPVAAVIGCSECARCTCVYRVTSHLHLQFPSIVIEDKHGLCARSQGLHEGAVTIAQQPGSAQNNQGSSPVCVGRASLCCTSPFFGHPVCEKQLCMLGLPSRSSGRPTRPYNTGQHDHTTINYTGHDDHTSLHTGIQGVWLLPLLALLLVK
eukprot:scaffold64005_cov23-Tisochrysis_lutea.AAC.1